MILLLRLKPQKGFKKKKKTQPQKTVFVKDGNVMAPVFKR